MERSMAEELGKSLLEMSGKIDRSVALVMEECDQDLASVYRRFAGRIMGLIFTNLLMKIYSEYPDLEPPSLKNRERREPGRFPLHVSEKLLALTAELEAQLREALSLNSGSSSQEVGIDEGLRSASDEIFDEIRDTAEFIRRRT